MSRLDELKTQILADGKIDDAEVDLLRRELYADGKIDRDEAEFLITLRNQAKETTPGFETLSTWMVSSTGTPSFWSLRAMVTASEAPQLCPYRTMRASFFSCADSVPS